MECLACRNRFEMPAERCPHCAEPGIFPNVVAAEEPANCAALEKRFQEAIAAAVARGCDHLLRDFFAKLTTSHAVIARWIGDVERLAQNDKQVYASYYQQRRAQLRQPDGDPWDALREPTDQALFGEHKEHIRFAALTLDGVGVLNYGDWSLVLRTPMIERRASTFEDNTAVLIQRRRIPLAEVNEHVRGFRATWADRGKLGAAKLGAKITPSTSSAEFPSLLMVQGPPGKMDADELIEVHIWGPLTIRTVEKITLTKSRDTRRTASKARLRAIREQLAKVDVELEVRP